MAIYRSATFHLNSESIDRCKAAIREYVAHIKTDEPGVSLYVSLQDQVNPNRIVHFYRFENEQAERAHAESPLTRRFADQIGPELAGPISFGDYDLIAES